MIKVCNLQYIISTKPLSIFLSSNVLSSVRTGCLKSILLAYFRDSGRRNFHIRDP